MAMVRGVVVHWTASPGASAQNVCDDFAHQAARGQARRYAGAHYVVGLDGEVVRCVPDGEVTYHCGARRYTDVKRQIPGTENPNNNSIGVELCHPDRSGEFLPATIASAARLVLELCCRHWLDPSRHILRHFDVTGKVCPRYFVRYPEAWERFKLECRRRSYETAGR